MIRKEKGTVSPLRSGGGRLLAEPFSKSNVCYGAFSPPWEGDASRSGPAFEGQPAVGAFGCLKRDVEGAGKQRPSSTRAGSRVAYYRGRSASPSLAALVHIFWARGWASGKCR